VATGAVHPWPLTPTIPILWAVVLLQHCTYHSTVNHVSKNVIKGETLSAEYQKGMSTKSRQSQGHSTYTHTHDSQLCLCISKTIDLFSLKNTDWTRHSWYEMKKLDKKRKVKSVCLYKTKGLVHKEWKILTSITLPHAIP